jgi:transcription termination factor Rho
MAGRVEVDHDGLQKSKLITAILDSDKFEASMLPEPAAEQPAAKAVDRSAGDGSREKSGDQMPQQRQGAQNRGGQGQGQGQRSRRRRGRGPREPIDESELEVREGILDILPEGYGFLRCTGYLPGEKDVYVSANIIRKNRLRKGDICTGPIRPARAQEKFPALVRPLTVNGTDPEEAKNRPKFADRTPLFPDVRLHLEVEGESNHILPRIVDLIAPIGKGQRGLIVSPPKAGKTTVLKEIANSITSNNPECHLMVVLVDERPEEVTDMQRSVKGEVIFSTFDRPAEEHTQVSELAIERAKRLVETGTEFSLEASTRRLCTRRSGSSARHATSRRVAA